MTKAEKRFGLTIGEIRELKIWYVKQQDFETASLWRELERKIVPLSKKEAKRLKMIGQLSLLKETVYPVYLQKYGNKNFFTTMVKIHLLGKKNPPKGWSLNNPKQ